MQFHWFAEVSTYGGGIDMQVVSALKHYPFDKLVCGKSKG